MFSANVGEASDLTFYHDGVWSGSVFLPGSGDVRYSIQSTADDIGDWRARAAVFNHPECYAEAAFHVDEVPGQGPGAVVAWVLGTVIVAVLLVGAIAIRRRRRVAHS